MLSIRLTLHALRVILDRPTDSMEVTRMIKKTIQKRPLDGVGIWPMWRCLKGSAVTPGSERRELCVMR